MRINVWKVSTVVLAGALAAVVSGNLVGEATAEEAEKQPHMKAALKLLGEADTQLEKATADKGGHRVKAREHLKNTIEEVKKGIAYDNKN
jgi:hypothetical protein